MAEVDVMPTFGSELKVGYLLDLQLPHLHMLLLSGLLSCFAPALKATSGYHPRVALLTDTSY